MYIAKYFTISSYLNCVGNFFAFRSAVRINVCSNGVNSLIDDCSIIDEHFSGKDFIELKRFFRLRIKLRWAGKI